MTTLISYATEQPYLVVIVASIVYVFFAAGHWSWTMLPDAGLAALYAWRPSLGCLAFVLLIGVIRHTPRLAAELASLFKLDTFDGWTDTLIHYLLPSLPVKPFADDGLDVMSRSTIPLNHVSASSLGTDGTADGRTNSYVRPSAEQLLTLYKLMRAHNIKRDDARIALGAAGLPLSSDLWAKAAPPPPAHNTPVAERPTNAAFRDPDYPYQDLS